MANRVMGEVELTIGDQPRVLCLDFEAFEEIGRKLDEPDFPATVDRLRRDLGEPVQFSTVWITLAAALRRHWAAVDEAMVRRCFFPRDLPRIAGALIAALSAAMGPTGDEDPPAAKGNGHGADPPAPAAAGTHASAALGPPGTS